MKTVCKKVPYILYYLYQHDNNHVSSNGATFHGMMNVKEATTLPQRWQCIFSEHDVSDNVSLINVYPCMVIQVEKESLFPLTKPGNEQKVY